MNKLPIEILNKIFIQLPIVQKQECMLVCKLWNNAIYAKSLFHTVSLSIQPRLFKKFFEIMTQNPDLCRQVEELILPRNHETCDRRILLCLFPRLRVIKTEKLRNFDFDYSIDYVFFDPKPFCCRLQHIEDTSPYEITRTLLKPGMGSCITKFTLNGYLNDSHLEGIIQCLKQASTIKYLKLSSVVLTIMDFDLINDSLPLLQSFEMVQCDFTTTIMPTVITPKTTLTTLVLILIPFRNSDYSDIPRYLGIKYPKLEHFNYTLWIDRYTTVNAESLIKNGYSLMLKSFGVCLKSLVLICFNDNSWSLNSILHHCGPQLSHLALHNVGILKLDALARSEQFKNIKSLSLYEIERTLLKWVKKMNSLESLTLEYNVLFNDYCAHLKFMMDLNDLFKSCPDTLASVSISSPNKFCLQEIDCNLYIKNLTLLGNRLPLGSDLYLGSAFPKLHTLCAEFEVLPHSTLSFQKYQFKLLDIHIDTERVALMTLDDNRTRYFNLKLFKSRSDYSVFGNEMLPSLKDTFDNQPFVTIICGSLKSLIINGIPANF